MYIYMYIYIFMYIYIGGHTGGGHAVGGHNIGGHAVGVVHIIVPLRSVLTNGMTKYHRQVSYGRHMYVSRTALADLSFTDCT